MSRRRLRWVAGALLGVLLVFAGCGDDDASAPLPPRPDGDKYSDLTLVGPWLLLSPVTNCHLEADGMGNITEHGFINEGSPPGYYTVASDGSFGPGSKRGNTLRGGLG